MDAITSFFTGLNWAAPSWDLFILLFFVIGALLYGFSLGRDRIVVILVSIYMALAVAQNAPIINQINMSFHLNDNIVLKISMFLGIFVVLFFLLSRSALRKTIGDNSATGAWWQVIVFAILQCGLLISITLTLLPPEMTSAFSASTRQIFTGDIGRSIWLIAPIIVMALGPKQKTEG